MKKLITLLFGSLICASSIASQKPNVIVIMADDLGFGDLACYGAKNLPTPNVDSLANEGLRFNAGYTTASTCTPTRFSFITGIYAFRQNNTNIAPPNAPSIIKEETVTFPELMQKAGYKTAVIGKWHLGLGVKSPDWNGELKPGPIEHGFNYNFILPTTNDRVPCVYVENHTVANLDPNDPLDVPNKPRKGEPNGIDNRDTLKLDWDSQHNQSIHNGISRIGWFYGGYAARWRDEDMAFDFIAKAKSWIRENKNEKFFLFFTPQDVHAPRMPNERFQGKSIYGLRGDAILEFDWSVGEIIRVLKEENLFDNTLIIVSSDNGPVLYEGYKDDAIEKRNGHNPSGIYRGGKYNSYEGGARTPFIAYWKGKILPQVSDLPISTIDLSKSICSIVGAEVKDGALPDAVDMSSTLLGKETTRKRDFIFFEGVKNCSYQENDWKLIVSFDTKQTNVLPVFNNTDDGVKYELFNLKDDPSERKNIVKDNPEIEKDLREKIFNLMKNRL